MIRGAGRLQRMDERANWPTACDCACHTGPNLACSTIVGSCRCRDLLPHESLVVPPLLVRVRCLGDDAVRDGRDLLHVDEQREVPCRSTFDIDLAIRQGMLRPSQIRERADRAKQLTQDAFDKMGAALESLT